MVDCDSRFGRLKGSTGSTSRYSRLVDKVDQSVEIDGKYIAGMRSFLNADNSGFIEPTYGNHRLAT